MKYLIITSAIVCALISCDQSANNTQALQKRIDSLEHQLADTYKPGFGEFMSNIQVHHAKLWFAGQNNNWQLADFEVHEITESLEDIKKYMAERKESKLIGLLDPALDSINYAIRQQDPVLFKNSFIILTNSCNSCHRETEFSFNVVKIPEAPPFTNQSFTSPDAE